MEFSKTKLFLLLTALLILAPKEAYPSHVTDRKVQATDIVNAAGVSVFKFPTTAPTANRVCTINADGEATSSSVTEAEFLASILPTQEGQSGKFLKTNGTSTSWDTVTAPVWGAITGTLSSQTDLQTALDAKAGLTSNTFTGEQTITRAGLGTTTSDAVNQNNTTAAAAGSQQVSPATKWSGRGWKTNATAASQEVGFRSYVLPIQGTSAPTGEWHLQSSVNGASYADRMVVSTAGFITASDGFSFSGAGTISLNNSSYPSFGTDHLTFTNPSGSITSISFKYGSTVKAGLSVNNAGTFELRASNSGGYVFNVGNSISSQTFIAGINQVGITTSNNTGVFAQGDVSAGSQSSTQPGRLTSHGSLALKGKYVTSSYTMTKGEAILYCDASNSNTCTGTPASACSSYTSSGTCTAHSGAGCSWAAGGSCSDANSTDSGTCTGLNAACSWETADCSAFNNDSSGCSAAGFPSGGFCSFSPSSCSDFTTITACNDQTGDGCTSSTAECAGAFFDETACNEVDGCSWNGSSCDGDYLTSCDGSYSGPNGTCSGSYDTGNCNGGSFGTCNGTALCSNLTDDGSSACTAESGCSWSTGLTITLPSIASTASNGDISAPDVTGWIARIMNIGSTGNVTVTPSGTDTMQYPVVLTPAPSPTPSALPTHHVTLHPLVLTQSCSTYNDEQSNCEGQTGCTWSPPSCGEQAIEEDCNSLSSGCSWNGSSCDYDGTTGDCNGSFITGRKWMNWTR